MTTDNERYEIIQRAATEATVEVTVPPQEVRDRLDAVYRRYAREAHVPGFRKGHVPRRFLDSRFGREAFLEETQEELQRHHLPEALSALSLRPMSTPRLEIVSFDEAEPFVFRASFSVLPEIDLPEYNGLEVTVPPLRAVSDDDVQRTLEDVQAQFGTLGEKEGVTVSDGDIVRVRERGQEWDTRADAENPVTNRLVGTKVGTEVEIDTELARGKRVRTKLEVVGLRQVVLPEIDDELAKDAGFDNLDALKADIRAKLAAARAEKRRNLIEARLLDVLVEKTEIPLPEPFVEDLVNEEAEKLKGSLDDPRSSMTFEEYLERRGSSEEALREELCESISVRLRRELVLRRLAMDASIDVDDDELTRLAEADAEASGDDSLRFIGRLKADDRWDDYRRSKVDERVLALLRESAVVKEGKE